MKGIILAGGSGTRLYPITLGVCKQLLPVYDKPMIYYPLSTLLLAGIREILIITTPSDRAIFERLLKDGRQLGVKISYAEQPWPRGLADAFIVGESFIGSEPVCLILGDNIFYSEGLTAILESCAQLKEGARIFGYFVHNPEEYGVVEFDSNRKVINLEEKPKIPKSNYAVPGIYFYDGKVTNIAKGLVPSARGEIEITDINRAYLQQGGLQVELLGRGTAWLDTGTHAALIQASNFIQTVESRQGLKIGCPEEIAYRRKLITRSQLEELARPLEKTEYGRYLARVISE